MEITGNHTTHNYPPKYIPEKCTSNQLRSLLLFTKVAAFELQASGRGGGSGGVKPVTAAVLNSEGISETRMTCGPTGVMESSAEIGRAHV